MSVSSQNSYIETQSLWNWYYEVTPGASGIGTSVLREPRGLSDPSAV